MPDVFAPYEEGLAKLERELGDQQEQPQAFLEYKRMLRANTQQARDGGDTLAIIAERRRIIYVLDAVSLEAAGVRFGEICGLGPDLDVLTTRHRMLSLSIVLLNALAVVILSLALRLVVPKLTQIFPRLACTSLWVVASSLSLLLLMIFHLVWRYCRSMLAPLTGAVNVAKIDVPIKLVVSLGDVLHPWGPSDTIAWISVAGVVLFAVILGSSLLFLFPPLREDPPVVQRFTVQFLEVDSTQAFKPGDQVELEPAQQVLVRAECLQQEEPLCTWSALNGSVEPVEGCAVLYSAPFDEADDILSVKSQSFCKTHEAYASLHISVKRP
jgi:hypothetical protein